MSVPSFLPTRTARSALVALFAVGLVAAAAGPAFAHHPIVSGTSECAENGHQIVTWTVSNSETVSGTNRTMTLDQVNVSSGSVSGIAVGTAFPPSPLADWTQTATTDLPGSQTGTVTLQVRGDWSPGADAPQNVVAISDPVQLAGGCVDTTPTTTSSTTTTTSGSTTTTTQAAATTTTTAPHATTTTQAAVTTSSTLTPAAVVAATTTTTGATQVLGLTLTAPATAAPTAALPRTGSPIGSTVSVGLIALLLGGLALRLARSTKKTPTVV